MSAVTHVEMYDGQMFCRPTHAWDEGEDSVPAVDWHEAAESVQAATCPECLAAIYMLGDSAGIALARLGLKIEVRNATEQEANPS